MMPLRLWFAIGAMIAAVGFLTWSHTHAYRAGKSAERVSRLEADVKAYEARKGIDHEVDGMDRYRICLDLGGLPDECRVLSRLDEATGSE